MSIKDVKKYYDQITADYSEMIESLKEMEELAAQQVVNPDRVEELRKAVEPLKNNYMRISYIMFLLNMPNKKEKKERYKKQQAKFLKNIIVANVVINGRCKDGRNYIKKYRLNQCESTGRGKEGKRRG